jgi:hypothetical protein
MSTINFDSPFAAAILDGAITTIDTHDLDGNPNRVLSPVLPFTVTVSWSNTGTLVPFMGGEYTVRVYAESMGPGPEREIGHTTVPVNGAGNYAVTLNVPAGVLAAAEPDLPNATGAFEPSGVYKLVAVVSYSNFGVNLPIAGFREEARMFEIRQP